MKKWSQDLEFTRPDYKQKIAAGFLALHGKRILILS
jgi:hypothetical protein